MNKRLYIIAAGLSSRMNGFPKHLCEIDTVGTTNLEHTILLAQKYYEDIVVVLNKSLSMEHLVKTLKITSKHNVAIKFIESGKGDGHAVYEAIKNEIDYEYVTCIWGDTYFSDCLFNKVDIKTDLLTVVCTKEISPYCYIVPDENNKISGMYFKNENQIGENDKYLHDQSMFVINVDEFIKHFYDYMEYCDNVLKTFVKAKNLEYSIIKFVNWFNDKNKTIEFFALPERTEPYSMSFNTFEELKRIKKFNIQKELENFLDITDLNVDENEEVSSN